ncbi:MAG: dTMP kinase [Chloroflexi bacterium]|nr:dTMP kinase [Chloroflexota bacterium]
MALFVSFEGGEGSGKSTQAKALYQHLLKTGIPVVLCHEPGTTPMGRRVRRLLKSPEETEISPLAELFLIAAARAQLVMELIRPNLDRGTTVVCDRYADSTVAYQGYGRGIDMKVIQVVNNSATQGVLPDLVVLLDIPVELGLARKGSTRLDRFESEEVSFHQRVRNGYLEIARTDPQRWLVIDATLPKAEIRHMVWGRVRGLLQSHDG